MRIGAGRFKGRKLAAVRGARPVSARLKTSLFSVLADEVPDATVLDLCAGIGGFGLEALSRGAGHVTLVDRDRLAVRALTTWIEQAGVADLARAVPGNWLKGPLPLGPFDLVFLDPPYEVWDGRTWPGGFERIRERIAADGLLIAKVPARLSRPAVAGWREVRATKTGSSAYWILRPEAPADPDSVKGEHSAAD